MNYFRQKIRNSLSFEKKQISTGADCGAVAGRVPVSLRVSLILILYTGCTRRGGPKPNDMKNIMQ